MTAASTIIVGLGNPILCDDGIGWQVARRVRELLLQPEFSPLDAEVTEACVGGLSLAELLVGYQQAIVVDAFLSEGGVPGTVYHFELSDLPGTLNTASAHDTNLSTALQALSRFGAEIPETIQIVAVEAEDVWTFTEECTPAVEASVPVAAATVMRLLKEAKRILN